MTVSQLGAQRPRRLAQGPVPPMALGTGPPASAETRPWLAAAPPICAPPPAGPLPSASLRHHLAFPLCVSVSPNVPLLMGTPVLGLAPHTHTHGMTSSSKTQLPTRPLFTRTSGQNLDIFWGSAIRATMAPERVSWLGVPAVSTARFLGHGGSLTIDVVSLPRDRSQRRRSLSLCISVSQTSEGPCHLCAQWRRQGRTSCGLWRRTQSVT